ERFAGCRERNYSVPVPGPSRACAPAGPPSGALYFTALPPNPTMRPTPIRVALTAALGLVMAACTDTGTELVTPNAPRHAVVSSTGLVITGVMPDPTRVADASGEWFEVYNGSTEPVDLQGYRIVSAAGLTASESHTIASSVVVEPGEYIVFGNNANTATNG